MDNEQELDRLLGRYKVEAPSQELIEAIMQRAQEQDNQASPAWAGRYSYRAMLAACAVFGFIMGAALPAQVNTVSVASASADTSDAGYDSLLMGATSVQEIML